MNNNISATRPPFAKRLLPQMGWGAAWIGKEEEKQALKVIRSKNLFRYYGRDPKNPPLMAARLENKFREMMGTRFALGVTSGSAALEVALGALGVGPGDEVIVPVWSWISCFMSVVRMGARPVLAEIDESFCLASGEITRLWTPRTKVAMVIHYQGVAADMDGIMKEARSKKIKVIEDCAEATGAFYRGKRIGSIGDIGATSFQYSKFMTSGEGGMVMMNDPRLYERAVRMHDLGMMRDYHVKVVPPKLDDFCGSQFRMSELTAAVALAQLRRLDKLRRHCRSLRDHLMAIIGKLPGLEFRRIPDMTGDNGFETYIFVPDARLAGKFYEMLSVLKIPCSRRTGTKPHYEQKYCQSGKAYAPNASPFRGMRPWPAAGYRKKDFPRTEAIVHRFIALPLGALYSMKDAEYIGKTFRWVYLQLMGK